MFLNLKITKLHGKIVFCEHVNFCKQVCKLSVSIRVPKSFFLTAKIKSNTIVDKQGVISYFLIDRE